MKVLVLGSGAREHALVKALAADPEVDAVIAAPGNPGIDATALCVPVDILDGDAVAAVAREHAVDLVVVGPEAPLVAGVADVCRCGRARRSSARRRRPPASRAASPSRRRSWPPPTCLLPLAHVCTTMDEVEAALDAFGAPHVVKDDGLAAGKGVVVTDSREVSRRARARLPRQARGAARRRGVPRRARGVGLLHQRRRDGRRARARAGLQAGRRRRRGPRRGRHGRLLAPRLGAGRARRRHRGDGWRSRPSTRCGGAGRRSWGCSTSAWR